MSGERGSMAEDAAHEDIGVGDPRVMVILVVVVVI